MMSNTQDFTPKYPMQIMKMAPYSDRQGQTMGLWKPRGATQHTNTPMSMG